MERSQLPILAHIIGIVFRDAFNVTERCGEKMARIKTEVEPKKGVKICTSCTAIAGY